jgi:hypothetical protein
MADEEIDRIEIDKRRSWEKKKDKLTKEEPEEKDGKT